jgi:hypothetical protein
MVKPPLYSYYSKALDASGAVLWGPWGSPGDYLVLNQEGLCVHMPASGQHQRFLQLLPKGF